MNVCDPDKPIVLAQVNQCCLNPSEVGEYVIDKVHVKFNAWFMEQMRGGVEDPYSSKRCSRVLYGVLRQPPSPESCKLRIER